MKESIKFVDKKKMLLVILFSVIYNLSIYGISFCASYFLVSPMTNQKLYMLLLSLIILYLISLISAWIYNHFYENFVWSTQYKTRNYYFMKLLQLDPKNITNYHSAYIQRTISMTAATLLGVLQMFLTSLLPLIIGIISYLVMAFSKSSLMAVASIFIFIIAFIVKYKMQKNRIKYTDEMYHAAGEYDATYDDFIQNIFTIIRLQSDKFVFNKLDEKVGQKGIKLSAGQQQRLNIIRGILLDKDFYFFDEPTSNLDSDSEEKIIKLINKYLKNKSIIIVSHRDRIKTICNKNYTFENHTIRLID